MRNLRIWLAQRLLPVGMTTTGCLEQLKLVNALRDALKEKDRLAEYASELEGQLGLIPKIERK
jgi:hypothetical protein